MRALDILGWPYVETTTSADFATNYDAGGWDIVVVETPSSGYDATVESRVLDRVSAGGRLIFSYWNLDAVPALRSAFGVTTTSYSSPQDLYPATGASVNLFAAAESFPAPLTPSSSGWGDNGDFLTLDGTAGTGEVLIAAGSGGGNAVGVLTNNNRTALLGFLLDNFQTTDADTDMTPDIDELMVNLYRRFLIL